MLHEIISGGQTGADQGGLMAAFDHGIPTSGYCPADYLTNLGFQPMLEIFGLIPTRSSGYKDRTKLNVKNSDATVVVGFNLDSPGSKLTVSFCKELGRPYHLVKLSTKDTDADRAELARHLASFIINHHVLVLNVAGNRDSASSSANFIATRQLLNNTIRLLDLKEG